MLNLSIMPLFDDHVEEVANDIIEQEKRGAFTHAMFQMKFNAEGTPPKDKASEYCKTYDKYRKILDKAGAKHGVLVQATLGHVFKPAQKHPFRTVVNLPDGTENPAICCPLDESFREYLKGQFKTLAEHSPEIVMIDDDNGLLYREGKGCACPLHLREMSRRLGREITREELHARTVGDSAEDERITKIYIELMRDTLVMGVSAMRAGLDEVNPKILGAVSGIYIRSFCEFTDDVAAAFAGNGNPRIVRLNGGMYTNPSGRGFSEKMFRAACLTEYLKGKCDILLAETDTCPQNRYSTSAARLNAHFIGSILEGATGAKHWITRLTTHEPRAGAAYRRALSENHKLHEALCEYYKRLTPIGARIPISKNQEYGFKPEKLGLNVCPWSNCVLERMGIPFYFGATGDGAVFLDDTSVTRFDDGEILEFLRGTLIISGGAIENLTARGFGEHLGVRAEAWRGDTVSVEICGNKRMSAQREARALIPTSDKTRELSYTANCPSPSVATKLFSTVCEFDNSLGGRVISFSGNPDQPMSYQTAFSFLCETRKEQLIGILDRANSLPIYYTEDAEVYLRAYRLDPGELFVAIYNLGLDVLDDIPLNCKEEFTNISVLGSDGELHPCEYDRYENEIRVKESLGVLGVKILIFR